MDSIFSKVNLPSIPVDLLNTLRIFFEKGSLQNKTLFEALLATMQPHRPDPLMVSKPLLVRYHVWVTSSP